MRSPLLLAIALLLPASPQDDPAKRARELVEKLRSESIAEREEATRKLKDLGRAAAAELERAAKGSDPAVAALAGSLLLRLQLIDSLSPALQKAMPGIAERLAFGDDPAWTRAFLDAEPRLQPGSRLPLLKRLDLEPLAARAVRGAATPEQKSDVGEAVIGRRLASAMPELLKFLDEPDEQLRTAAIEAIRRNPSSKGVQRLRDLTRHENAGLRRFALDGLAELEIKEAAPDAARLIADADSSVRAVAAAASAHLRGKGATPDLVRLLKDDEALVRRSAVSGLLAIYAKEEAPRLAGLLRDPDMEVRRRSAGALGLMGAKEAIPQITALLKDGTPEVRCSALGALKNLRAVESVPEALKFLADDTKEEELAILQEMVIDLAPAEAKERALALLKHENSRVRVSALDLLGKLGASGAAPEILKLLKDREEHVRWEAAWAAGQVGLREAIPDLLKMLEGSTDPEQEEAIAALAMLGVKEAIPKIVERLKVEGARDRVMRALVRLNAKESVPAIAPFLKSDRELSRMWAMWALARLEGRDAVPRIAPLLEDAAESICTMTLQALAELEAWDQKSRVAPLLEDRSPEVRAAAAAWLARAGSREGVEILLEGDEDAEVWVLNALRSPEAWKRLQRLKATGRREGTAIRKVRLLAKEAGVAVEVEESPLGDGERWLDRESWLTEFDGPTPMVDALWHAVSSKYEVILEADRIRLVPREAGLNFWRAWWKESAEIKK